MGKSLWRSLWLEGVSGQGGVGCGKRGSRKQKLVELFLVLGVL